VPKQDGLRLQQSEEGMSLRLSVITMMELCKGQLISKCPSNLKKANEISGKKCPYFFDLTFL